MRYIVLDGLEMVSIEMTHLYLKEKFQFPDYYGENLDALWDELSTLSTPTHVEIINEDAFFEQLEGYADEILSVFLEAELENKNFVYEK